VNQEERLSGALQENILTLLCFDDLNCKLVRAAVSPKLFESAVFREVAGHAIDFIDQYGEAIKDHLPDHLETVLKGDDRRKASTYERLLENLFQSRETINSAYIITQLHKFVRLQNLKSSMIKSFEALESGNIDQAEVEMQKGLNTQVVVFESGLSLSKPEDVGAIMDAPEEEGFDLGIEELDRNGIIPRRKELTAFLAPRGKGKSWFLTHCCKQALLQGWSCLIITLEMSERRYGARMLQSFFSISRRQAEVKVTRLTMGKGGQLEDMIQEKMTRPTMRDEGIKTTLMNKAKREFRRRRPFRIKEFPTHSLTMPQLKAYLDGLERFENFTPDLICVDYPALMNIDAKNLRIELSNIIAELRGVAGERNAAVVVAGQGNRESEKAKMVTGDMAAEDISILAHADTLFTYSQTKDEYDLGLARLFVEKARNEEAKQIVLLTQAYAIGQFCLDSVKLNMDYWAMLADTAPDGALRRRRRNDEGEE
jgi:hypothetical protein